MNRYIVVRLTKYSNFYVLDLAEDGMRVAEFNDGDHANEYAVMLNNRDKQDKIVSSVNI